MKKAFLILILFSVTTSCFTVVKPHFYATRTADNNQDIVVKILRTHGWHIDRMDELAIVTAPRQMGDAVIVFYVRLYISVQPDKYFVEIQRTLNAPYPQDSFTAQEITTLTYNDYFKNIIDDLKAHGFIIKYPEGYHK